MFFSIFALEYALPLPNDGHFPSPFLIGPPHMLVWASQLVVCSLWSPAAVSSAVGDCTAVSPNRERARLRKKPKLVNVPYVTRRLSELHAPKKF